MKRKDTISIGDIYGKMLNPLRHSLKESKHKNKNAFGDQPDLIGDGPKTDGYHKALNDEEDCPCDEDEEEPHKKTKGDKVGEFYSNKKKKVDDSDDSEEIDSDEVKKDAIWNKKLKESKKNSRRMVNSIMSKSVFDKLYSKVLKENFGQEDNDVDALGLDDSTPDSDLGDEFGGEDDLGGDEVTFTLPKDVAQQLVDVLQAVLGGEEDLGDDLGGEDDLDFGGEDDLGGDEFGAEEDEMSFEEDEEVGTKTAPDKKKAFMGKDNKVSGPPKPKGGQAKADVTDDTNTSNSAPPITALQGKNNQVPGSTLKKASDYFK
jgi:hypothetical protein